MARKISEIYNQITSDNKLAQVGVTPHPDNFTAFQTALSTSKVAEWRLMVYVISVAIFVHELVFDAFRKEVNSKLATQKSGTPPWYQYIAYRFQMGDTLVWNSATFTYDYAAENLAARIIKRCTVEERADGVLLVKVAKLASGVPAPLDSIELAAFNDYMTDKKFAGTRLSAISLNPDLLKILGTIYYSPQVPVASVQSGVAAAINGYLSTLPFDGKLRITGLVDAIQAVPGVSDVDLSDVSVQAGSNAYSSIDVSYRPLSGYFEIDSLYPLSTSLNYVAE